MCQEKVKFFFRFRVVEKMKGVRTPWTPSGSALVLPCVEGLWEQFDAAVIITLLNVTLFFENGDRNAVSPGRWHVGHSVVMIMLTSLHSVTTLSRY